MKKDMQDEKLLASGFALADALPIISGLLMLFVGIAILVAGALNDNAVGIISGIVVMILSVVETYILWVFIKLQMFLYFDVKRLRKALTKTDTDENLIESDEILPQNKIGDDRIKNLREIKSLYDEGILSEEEFNFEKQKLLKK